MDKTKLEILREQQAKIQARISELEAQAKSKDRRELTRLKIILGALLLADAELHEETRKVIRGLVEKAVTTPRDKMFLAEKLKGRL